jgi:hypothetical protein
MARASGKLAAWFALTIVVSGVGLANAVPASAASSVTLCAGGSFSGSMLGPAHGFASYVEMQMTASCQLHVVRAIVVPANQIPTPLGMTTARSSRPVVSLHGGPVPATLIDPTATVYQRSWDCCGVDMNGLYTTIQWDYAGGLTYPYNQWNMTYYTNDGWALDYQTLQYTGGCYGCAAASLQGVAGYRFFDGSVYYNSYTNYITAYGDGSFNCNYTFYWKHTAGNWSHQAWCAYGYNSGT